MGCCFMHLVGAHRHGPVCGKQDRLACLGSCRGVPAAHPQWCQGINLAEPLDCPSSMTQYIHTRWQDHYSG